MVAEKPRALAKGACHRLYFKECMRSDLRIATVIPFAPLLTFLRPFFLCVAKTTFFAGIKVHVFSPLSHHSIFLEPLSATTVSSHPFLKEHFVELSLLQETISQCRCKCNNHTQGTRHSRSTVFALPLGTSTRFIIFTYFPLYSITPI